MDAYILSRPRHLAGLSSNRGNLKILFEGDKQLFNPYGVMLVNPPTSIPTSSRADGPERSSTG